MENIFKALKEKNLVYDENHCLIDYNFGGTMAQETFRNHMKNAAAVSKHAW